MDMTSMTVVSAFHNTTTMLVVESVEDNDVDDYTDFYKGLYSKKTAVFVALRLFLTFVGWFGNIVNIRTFLKMGLNDSVTIVFFNLALADLNYINVMFVQLAGWLLEYAPLEFILNFKVHPKALGRIATNTFSFVFLYATTYLTTFLSVQRCLCIIKPLHFGGMFTRFRTCLVIGLIWLYAISINFTPFGWMHLVTEKVPGNRSWITATYAIEWDDFLHYLGIIEGVLEGTCQGLVAICAFIMARELAKSVKFRQSTSIMTKGEKQPANEVEDGSSKSEEKSMAATSKERRIIIQVTIVTVIFILSNFHSLFFQLIRLHPAVENYFAADGWYKYNMYYLPVGKLLKMINASSNFFVYYKYNTKFRQLCFK